MQYPEIIQYLYSQLPMFHRVGPAAYKANLNNTIAISKHFNQPEKEFKSIHIAGTNGKGSTAHMIASILQEKGLKTGLCTSPHLKDFRERIKINGKKIPKDYICDFFNNNIDFIDKLSPSFFELTIGLTFKYFADRNIDIAVIETGMGGRLDSTNIINPLISIITNISLDHTNLLGNTLEKIAFEKAGIIKQETPVIIGQKQKGILNVFVNKAEKYKSPIFFADNNFSVKYLANKIETRGCYYKYYVENFDKKYYVESGLGGAYQANNIATVMQSIEVLNSYANLGISQENIKSGLKKTIENTGLKGRWEVIGEKPLTICDTGHNPEAVKQIVKQLKSRKYNKLHIVIGLMNDKNIENVLMHLPADAFYYFTNANLPRALKADALKSEAERFSLKGEVYKSVHQAFETAKTKAGQDDLIFIGGSTFVVSEIM